MHIPALSPIGRKIHNRKNRLLTTKDYSISIPDQEIAVLRKWSFHWIPLKALWDGMEVPLVIQRKSFENMQCNIQYVEEALSLYREFDEDTASYVAYWFGIKQRKLSTINEYLSLLDTPVHAMMHWKFLALQWAWTPLPTQYHEIFDWLKIQGEKLTLIASILYGLFIVYWTFIGNDAAIFYGKIEIPLVWSIMYYQEFFEHLKIDLQTCWCLVRFDYQNTRFGQNLHIWVYDWEILQFFAGCASDKRNIAKKEQIIYELPRLIEFLLDWSEGQEYIDHISKYTIKLSKT